MSALRILATVLVAAALGWAGGVWLGAGEPSPAVPPPGDAPAAVAVPAREAAGPAEEASAPPRGGAGADAPPDPSASPGAATADGAQAPAALGRGDIEALLASLPARERDGWLADAGALGRLVEEESALRSVLSAAAANDALGDPLTALLVQRARDRTLVDLYLARVVRANLSPDWPSEADVDQFIREQPDRFRVPERVPVWQVFLPVAADADAEVAAAAEKRAEGLATALRRGAADFALVALEHSGHAASRAAGGFMGLLAVPDLLPEVRERIGSLEVGKVSEPVRTTQGFHILKVGERQSARELTKDEARALAREELLREATAAIRKAAVEKIREQHPVAVIDEDIDAWHQRLLSRDWSAVANGAAASAPDAEGDGSDVTGGGTPAAGPAPAADTPD